MDEHVRSGTDLLSIRLADVVDSPVLMLTGEVDLSTTEQLASALRPLRGHLVVDLEGVSFLDCAGIGTFVKARNRVAVDGGALHFRAPRDDIRRELEILALDGWIIGEAARS